MNQDIFDQALEQRSDFREYGVPDKIEMNTRDGAVVYEVPDLSTRVARGAAVAGEYIMDSLQGVVHGGTIGAENMNRMIPGASYLQEKAGDFFDWLGVDTSVAPPETWLGGFASGLGQALPGMVPFIGALKQAGYGRMAADVIGGIAGDFVTSGHTDAQAIASLPKAANMAEDWLGMTDLISPEAADEVSAALEDFITSDNATIEDLNSRLVGAMPGAILGPLVDGLGKLAVMAKDAGLERFAQGKSIIPGPMSIEDVSDFDSIVEGQGGQALGSVLYRESPIPDFNDNIERIRLLPAEQLNAERKNGLLPFLYETATPQAPIKGYVKTINQKNADKAFLALDEAAARHPEPASSPEAWVAYQADLMGKKPGQETAVSLPPYQLIRYKNNPEDLTNVMRNLTPDQEGMAKSGLDMAETIGQSYARGEMTNEDTAELLMWGMFSRQKSAFPHEAAFIDMVSHTDSAGRNLRTFVDKAVAGEFGKADIEEYLQWAKSAMPAGVPGRAAIDNVNAFGKNMLPALSRVVDGESVLSRLHKMISDPEKSGREIRREFFKLAEGSGIDNKVLSFVLLLTGRKDVMVLDRIQFNHMWNDGRFGNYNLYTPVTKLNPDGTTAMTPNGKPQMMTGSTISDIGKNAYGLMIYEAMERELETILPNVYQQLGREYRGIGQFHWESWVLTSQQEAAHPSVSSFVQRTNAESNVPHSSVEAGTYSREGRFDAAAYGAEYGKTADGERIVRYPNSQGQMHQFTVDGFNDFLKEVRKPKNGVVYKGFKFEDFSSGTTPWVKDDRIDKQKLDDLIASKASRTL